MPWWDRVLRPEVLVPALIFGLPVIAVICGSAVAVLKHRSDNDLKRTMLQRGMSPEEIERVIKAGPRTKS